MKLTKRQLRKLIQEAMYSSRGRRDAEIDKLGEPFTSKLKMLVTNPNPGTTHPNPENVNSGNELLKSIAGYKPSYEFPHATDYTEEIKQFDQKMRDSWYQMKENKLKDEDRRLRKLIVDYLFDPTGIWRIPVDRLNPNTKHPDGIFKMDFEEWDHTIPKDYLEPFKHNWGQNPEFEARAEKVFRSMGGSYYQGDGATLVPLAGINQQDQIRFNKVILKVLNNDPQFV